MEELAGEAVVEFEGAPDVEGTASAVEEIAGRVEDVCPRAF